MYQRYIRDSYAEFSVAKDIYVEMRTGWFSERSACYLASGRPVVVQDTGCSRILPSGTGLLTFESPEQALEAISSVRRHYEEHCRSARDIAASCFDAHGVLRNLLGIVGL